MNHPYTMTITGKPSVIKNLLFRLENALVYIGYVVGLILVIENLTKIAQGVYGTSVTMLFTAVVVWFGGYVSRLYFTRGRNKDSASYTKREKFRVEFLYFLFSYTFTTLFMTTFIKYMPTYAMTSGVTSYSFIADYLSRRFLMTLFIDLIIFTTILLGVLSFTEYLYQVYFVKDKYFRNSNNIEMTKLFLLSLFVLGIFILIRLPFLNTSLAYIHSRVIGFFVNSMSWVVDYILAFPIFYYLVVSFKGSLLAEKFSTYKRPIF